MKDKNLKKLNSKQGEKVSGGYIYHDKDSSFEVKTKPWMVVGDSRGSIKGRYATEEEAKIMANVKGFSDKEISEDDRLIFENIGHPVPIPESSK